LTLACINLKIFNDNNKNKVKIPFIIKLKKGKIMDDNPIKIIEDESVASLQDDDIEDDSSF
jgi:hypothetical protein